MNTLFKIVNSTLMGCGLKDKPSAFVKVTRIRVLLYSFIGNKTGPLKVIYFSLNTYSVFMRVSIIRVLCTKKKQTNY